MTFRDGFNSFSVYYNMNNGKLVADKSNRNDKNAYSWSLVAMTLWRAMCARFSKPVNSLSATIRYDITNPKTQMVINEILGIPTKAKPGLGEYFDYKQGRDDFYALVGTPNGKGVTYLLFQNRGELGHTTIQSVRIWVWSLYSLEFTFKDASTVTKRSRRQAKRSNR